MLSSVTLHTHVYQISSTNAIIQLFIATFHIFTLSILISFPLSSEFVAFVKFLVLSKVFKVKG
jgi:hypothetical protein